MSDHTSGQGHPSPGWYPDPERPGNRRWWDGLAWTDYSEPLDEDESAPEQPAPPPPGRDFGSASGSGRGQGGHAPPAYGSSSGGYPSSQAGSGYGTTGFAGAGSSGAVAPNIDPWLWQSILVTLLCCLPLGIVGIVFASQAQTELGRGNYREAQEKASQARTFTLVGFGVGLVSILLGVLFLAA